MSDYKLNEDAPAFSYTREELFSCITKIVSHPHKTLTSHDEARALAIFTVFEDYFSNFVETDGDGGYFVYDCDAMDFTEFVKDKLGISDYDDVDVDDVLK
jgi:hypothetical protein